MRENEKRKNKKREGKKEIKGEKVEEMGRKERISRCSDCRSSAVRELNLVHLVGATHGYQNQCVSSNSKR